MRYFVSGHRDLTQEEFDEHYIPLIQKVFEQDKVPEFNVGDWEGCDALFLDYVSSLNKCLWVNIYSVKEPRNNPTFYEGHPEKIFTNKQRSTYDECDASMTRYSDFDIAWIRPGREDSHTAKNIKRRYNL